MNNLTTPVAWLCAVAAATSVDLYAGSRSSTNYTISTDIADSGGGRTASANYTNDGSAGAVGGISTGSAVTVKAGYPAQLYDVTGFAVTASAPGMNETGSLQLEPVFVLDDATHLGIAPTSVTWSVLAGPITVTANGIASADIVYQNTPATARGTLGALSDDFEMTVYDGLPDNYGSYAGDGIDDSWQFQYFGLDNPLAARGEDADADRQDNLFEWLAGTIPINPLSRFLFRIEPVIGEPTYKDLVFSPVLPDCIYTVQWSGSLAPASWADLTGATQTDANGERTVTDTEADDPEKFYKVKLEKP